jgi:hypothetical protein
MIQGDYHWLQRYRNLNLTAEIISVMQSRINGVKLSVPLRLHIVDYRALKKTELT